MKPATALKLVPTAPAEPVVNVSDLVRADIARRDWARAMVWADKQPAVQLAEHKPWRWW